MGDIHSEGVQARSPAFFQKAPLASFGMTDVASSQNSLARSIIKDFPRGGAEGEEESEEAITEVLYLPGLLEVELIASDQVSILEVTAKKSKANFGARCSKAQRNFSTDFTIAIFP